VVQAEAAQVLELEVQELLAKDMLEVTVFQEILVQVAVVLVQLQQMLLQQIVLLVAQVKHHQFLAALLSMLAAVAAKVMQLLNQVVQVVAVTELQELQLVIMEPQIRVAAVAAQVQPAAQEVQVLLLFAIRAHSEVKAEQLHQLVVLQFTPSHHLVHLRVKVKTWHILQK
jgi:hypothetical protein